MKKNDLRSLARNPQFIPGIYNYCDRWCERCPFTSRCLSFAMEQEERKRPAGQDRDRRAFWKKFEDSLKGIQELLNDQAKAQGITLAPAEMEKIGRQVERRRRAAEQHPLAKAALRYSRMVDSWFKSGERLLREKGEEVLAQAKLGLPGVKEEVASLTDVVEILRWYQHPIYAKLMRGLDRNEEDEGTSRGPNDADGSVKVALIAIDRSISAWMKMKDFFPAKTDSILTLLVHLDRLRRAAETEFPKARSFVRPGFDTVTTSSADAPEDRRRTP